MNNMPQHAAVSLLLLTRRLLFLTSLLCIVQAGYNTEPVRELLSVDQYHVKDDHTHQVSYADGNAVPPPEELRVEIEAHEQRLFDVDILYTDDENLNIPPVFDDSVLHSDSRQAALHIDDVSVELLNSMEFSGVPSHRIRLSLGMVVVVTRNLDPIRGVMNGARTIVQSVSKSGRVVAILHPKVPNGCTQRYDPATPFLLHRIKFKCCVGYGNFMTRLQFPLRLSYAVSIHKSQSLTLDRVVIDLRSGVFEHGQLYVALSRVRNGSDVCFLLRPDQE